MKSVLICTTCLLLCLFSTVARGETLLELPLRASGDEIAGGMFDSVVVDLEMVLEEHPTTPTLHFVFRVENESDDAKTIIDPAREYRLLLFHGGKAVNQDRIANAHVYFPQNGRLLRSSDVEALMDETSQPDLSEAQPTTVTAGWRGGRMTAREVVFGKEADLVELGPGETYIVDVAISAIELEDGMSAILRGTYRFAAFLSLVGRNESSIVRSTRRSGPPMRKAIVLPRK